MPITKTTLKKVRQQAVIKFVGAGTSTIDLNSDLRLSDEIFMGYSNANVNISTIFYTMSNSTSPVSIVRNGTTIFELYGNDNWLFAQTIGAVENSNNTSNIQVTIPNPGGTVILGVTKATGYQPPNQQTLKDYEK